MRANVMKLAGAVGLLDAAIDRGRCRVLVRTRARLRHPGEVLTIELAGPLTAMLTRGLLLGVKHRVQACSADPVAP